MNNIEVANLEALFKEQAALDATIAANHNVNYSNTRPRRILALVVEIGELANATRCFKYWSNKGSEDKAIVLDEYADGLHFFLSLGIDIGSSRKQYQIDLSPNTLTNQFLDVYHLIDDFVQEQNEKNYEKAFDAFLHLIPLLGFSWNEVQKAYYEKLGTNYVRQDTNY